MKYCWAVTNFYVCLNIGWLFSSAYLQVLDENFYWQYEDVEMVQLRALND